MKKAKHTPGPWEVVTDNRPKREGRLSIRRAETFESVVYQLDPGSGFHMETHRADARLIAAAPELLACAEQVLSWLEHDGRGNSPLANNARRVIAKATGQKQIAPCVDTGRRRERSY